MVQPADLICYGDCLPHLQLGHLDLFYGHAAVVLLGAFPEFMVAGKAKALSMNLAIQIMMLTAGALVLIFCKVRSQDIPNGTVFKAWLPSSPSSVWPGWLTPFS